MAKKKARALRKDAKVAAAIKTVAEKSGLPEKSQPWSAHSEVDQKF